MALGLSTGSGEGGAGNFMPVLKYDARAGRFFRVDRSDAGGTWQTDNVDVTQGFQAIFDLENIEVGYIRFAKGGAPDFMMVRLGGAMPTRPDIRDDKGKPVYKQGFRFHVKLGKTAGGDVREFASTAGVVIDALDALHSAYEAGRAENPGKLPIVAMTTSTPVKSGESTNYAPNFEIVKWVDRPADLVGRAAPPAIPAPAATVTPITAARPAQAAAPQMRTTTQEQPKDVDEF